MYEDRLNNNSLPAPSMPLHQHRLEPLNLAGGERLMQEVSWRRLLGDCSCFAFPSTFPLLPSHFFVYIQEIKTLKTENDKLKERLKAVESKVHSLKVTGYRRTYTPERIMKFIS